VNTQLRARADRNRCERFGRMRAKGGRARSPTERSRRRRGAGEQGFTLIELLIVVTIIPLIVGAIAAGLLTILNLQSSVKNRITDSSDAQVVSSTFLKDVQSATLITTWPSSSPECGNLTGGKQLLGLQWAGGQTVVSYDTVPVIGVAGTTYSLVREYCTSGNTSTPSSTTTVAYDISGTQLPPCLGGATCIPSSGQLPQQWYTPAVAQAVKFVVTEAGTGFTYTLLAEPRGWTPTYVAVDGPVPVFSPVTALSTVCSTCLSVGNYGSITINSSLGTNGSSVAIASPSAGSVPIGTDATLTASTLLTTDPLLNSDANSSPPEYFSPQINDPLSGVLTKPTATGTGSCILKSGSTTVFNCSAGIYASTPTLMNNDTYDFDGAAGGTYQFPTTLNIPANATLTFNYGNYIFNGSTLVNGVPAAVTQSGSGAVTITGNNVLFYAPNGSIDFGTNSSVYLVPISGNDGVTIWDASTTNVNIENVQNNRNSYGGIYIPGGTVNASSPEAAANTSLSVMFLIANSINIMQYTNVIVTGP